MQGVRILEVAEHTFVPAASAILAEWGAEVIKIEHVERGDAMRGLASAGVTELGGNIHLLVEHSNRGKQSLGLDLTSEDGLDILYRLAATCDVFLTNKLPSVRKKLKIDLDDIRAHNPQIIYVRGTGQGDLGPDADAGSYDALAFWCRAGIATSLKQPEDAHVQLPPGPAFGDSIGAMTIAGGIMGALFHRERTGEATTVDVSLLGVGMWAMGATMALSIQNDLPWEPRPINASTGNPLVNNYETEDGRFLSLSCLQGARYWAEACAVFGIGDVATDARFADAKSLTANADAATELVAAAIKQHTAAEWLERLDGFSGQWVLVQNTLEAANDRQTVANGYVQEYEAADGSTFKMVTPPVQYGGEPPKPLRAPTFNEHGDDILAALGLDWDTVIDLKVRGVVA